MIKEEEEETEYSAKKVHWSDFLIIKENSKKKAAFDMFINIMVAYSCFTTIYYVAISSVKNP